MVRKITTKDFLERARKVHGDRYDYSKFGEYRTALTRHTFICPVHGDFEQSADRHLYGGCFKCGVERRARERVEKNRLAFEAECRKVHGNKYDYSKVDYKNIKNRVLIVCPKHGEFQQVADRHKRGGGCRDCKRDTLSRLHAKSHEQFLRDAISIHGSRYDYSHTKYIDVYTKVTIGCPKHGAFRQSPPSHLRGSGCPRCAGRGINTERFIRKCRRLHGDFYDYSKTKYRGAFEPIIVICPKHGKFVTPATKHSHGTGCPRCAIERNTSRLLDKGRQAFVDASQAIHGDRYDYSKSVYKGVKRKITIVCPMHGAFEQLAETHLDGGGCLKCAQESRIGPYGLTRAIRGDFDDDPPIYLYVITANSPIKARKVFKIGVGGADRIAAVCRDMSKVGFDIADVERKLYESKGEAIIIEQLAHAALEKSRHFLPPKYRFSGYTELFERKPNVKRIEARDVFSRFHQGDRWFWSEG